MSQHGLVRVVHNIWINLACLLAVGVLNWRIVAKPVVRLIKERGISYSQASHDLGVHQSQLRGWVKALAMIRSMRFPARVR